MGIFYQRTASSTLLAYARIIMTILFLDLVCVGGGGSSIVPAVYVKVASGT